MWMTRSWVYLEVMNKMGKVMNNSGAFWGEKSG